MVVDALSRQTRVETRSHLLFRTWEPKTAATNQSCTKPELGSRDAELTETFLVNADGAEQWKLPPAPEAIERGSFRRRQL